MHTGYDYYWMRNREETVPNLRNNDGLNDGVSLTNYNHIQCGRQRSNLNDFASLQKNLTSQNALNYFQKSSQYDWRTTSNQSSMQYNYQNMGVSMHQEDHRSYWQNLGQRHSENRSSVPQSLNSNNMYHSTYFSENQNSAAQMARIRVRDVNSLNNIAQNSIQNYNTLDKPLEWHLIRTDGEQQNRVSKDSIDHRNFSPSVFDANRFRVSYQKSPSAPKPSVYQEKYSNVYFKRREQVIPGSLYNLHNMDMRQNEPPYRTSTANSSILQDLLGSVKQVAISRSAKVPQNFQPVNRILNSPRNTTKDSNVSLPCIVENSYSLGGSEYRSQIPYSDSLQATKVSPIIKGNSLPHDEQTSSRIVEENAQSGESSIRVSAVISLPEWCGGRVLNEMPVSNNEKPNFMSGTSAKNTEDPGIFNNEPFGVVSNDASDDSFKVKEEPKMASEFFCDDTSGISIQYMKTEDFQEQEGGEPQNSGQISDENVPTASASTENTDNEDKNPNLYKGKINEVDKNPENNFTVGAETKNTRSEDSSNTREVKLGAAESFYKSQINRDKLDMLIEFIKGGDKHLDYISEQKSKKQKKGDDSISAKTNKPSSEKSKSSVKDALSTISSKAARIDITKLSPQDLTTVKADDSAKKPKKKARRKSKAMENLDKVNPKNDTKKRNFPDYVSQNSKDIQDHPKRNPEPLNKDVKGKPKKIETKSVPTENETQVTATKKNSELAEKSKKLKTDKEKTDADIKLEKEENHLQGNEEKAGNFQLVDINREEKSKVNITAGVVNTQSKVSSDSVSSPEENELEKKDQAQKNASGEDKRGRLIFSDMEYQLCDFCVTTSRAECFWMNIVSGEIKCLHCFKRMDLDAVEATRELSCDGKNQEAQTKKENTENVCSPNQKNDSQNQTHEKVVNLLDITSVSDDKKSQRRHTTESKELGREKRKSLDEHVLHEKKMKRRKSDEKSSRKAKDQISEALRSKTHDVSESSKSDKSNRKSFSKDTSPRKEERSRKNSSDHMRKVLSKDEDPISKLISKTETNWEGVKKRVNSTEDLRHRKIQIIEEMNKDRKDKNTPKSVEKYENGKKYEKTKDSWSPMGREKHGYDKKTNPKKTTFSWEKDLKGNHSAKAQYCEKSPDHRKKYDEKRKTEKEMARSTKEDEGKKKETTKGPLQYKDFVLKKSPVFCLTKPVKDGPFAEILE